MYVIVARRLNSGKKQYSVYLENKLIFMTRFSTNLKFYLEYNEKIKNGSDNAS